MYLLPSGDVLVAETNAPPDRRGQGDQKWVMGLLMKQAGAATKSANRIAL
ncbi:MULTISPECIES: hypothetical protein [Aeromonas]|nr:MULTISPECIES: hypothetical protein [Aeromonas]MCH7372953.1 hypothetical protein [Aeromonas sp. MR16]